ncbi:MAG: CPBP family intramembrane glutamic endopeptidase [Bacteroidota bacterium]|jgi:membrane protease YdiL (CAAX protease family)|nr:CPBP family intramembrane glutamic endopeptidase [Bacteroidota bacterium]MEC8758074.1 CPBP family intramembrane glutamic endopeptidase [Bacteroidota bacterium]
MTADHIQGISRSLIFLGLLLVGTVVASVVATFLSGVLFDGVVAMVPGGDMPTDDASWWQLHFQNLCSQALGFGGAVWLAIRLWDRSALQGLPGRSVGRNTSVLLLAILATVASGPLLMASYELNGLLIPEGGLLERLFKPLEEMIEAMTAFLASGEGVKRIVILLSVAGLPAIFEELSFRGVLQPLLIRATGSAFWGIALTAIVFSAIHFQFYGFLPRVLLGALFGWLAHRTGSLIPGMAAHFANNALAAVTLWVTGSMTDDILDLTPLVVIGGTAAMAACIYGVDRVIRQRPA